MISKEDIRNAFLTDQRKRNKMLYDFYKEAYFTKGYTANLIASKISDDLGIGISVHIIYKIYARIINKEKSIISKKSSSLNHSKNDKFVTSSKPSLKKVQNGF